MDAVYCGPSCRSAAAKLRRQERAEASADASSRRSSVLTSAFTRSVNRATAKHASDVAAVALARLYARTLDSDPRTLEKLGPQYLAVLVQLGMTPRARVETRRGDEVDRRSALDELRARRDDRKRRAAAVDAATSGADT